MKCVKKECSCTKTKIVSTKNVPVDINNCVLRTRQCTECGEKYLTIELPVSVVKGAFELISASTSLASYLCFGNLSGSSKDEDGDNAEAAEETEEEEDADDGE